MSKQMDLTAGWHELVLPPDPNGPGAANPIRTEQRRLAMGQSPRGRRHGLISEVQPQTERGRAVRDRALAMDGGRASRRERRLAGNLPEGAPGRNVLHRSRMTPVSEYRSEHLGERYRLAVEREQALQANREHDAMRRFARRNGVILDEVAQIEAKPRRGLFRRAR